MRIATRQVTRRGIDKRKKKNHAKAKVEARKTHRFVKRK
jgi:hypothetical protein